jgi:hypothetical protein
MHCSTTFKLLSRHDCNITSNITLEQWGVMRKLIVGMILSTDLQIHFEKVGEFRGILDSEEGLVMSEDTHRAKAMEILLKCADIGHSGKKPMIHRTWTMYITKEFFKQGDVERHLKLPVSPLCDRETVNIADSQLGFLKVLALPLFQQWEDFIESKESRES